MKPSKKELAIGLAIAKELNSPEYSVKGVKFTRVKKGIYKKL